MRRSQATSSICNRQNGSHSMSSSQGPSRASGSAVSTHSLKRNCDLNDIFEQTFKIPKRSCSSNSNMGPLYKETSESIVLYRPPAHETYRSVKNQMGYVKVIVNDEIQNGKENLENPCPLKPEQVEGLQFLWNAFSTKKGVILGHEMGLGKTRTAIAFIYTLLEQSEKSRGKSTPSASKIIIVAPKNAIGATWEDELEKWCPTGKVSHQAVFSHALNIDNENIINNFGKKQSSVQILILSYDSFKKHRNLFYNYEIPVDLVVCDEAHLLKNNFTDRSQSLRGLKSKLWVGLTGTPFQNTIEEFCNLVSFFQPGVLGNHYKLTYCRPIQNHLTKYKQLNNTTTKLFNELKNAALNVVQFKNNVINVDKHELIVCVGLCGKKEEKMKEMTLQSQMYEALTTQFKIMHDENDSSLNFGQKIDLLKKLCIHPEYAFNTLRHHPCLANVADLYKANYNSVKNNKSFHKGFYWLLFSGKLVILFAMLKAIKDNSPDEKAIVVSYSTKILDYILKICKSGVAERLGFNALKILVYKGGTSDAERSRVLAKFENSNDHFLLLLSGKAGGTALNLTRANHMFLLDPDWNPSNDKQALARIYRHCQTRTVCTYRFLSTGTIEESIFLLQLSKEEISAYLKAKEDNGKLRLPFSEKNLLTYHPNTRSSLQYKLKKLCQETDRENYIAENNGYESIELQYFAKELSCAKQYCNKTSIPDELGILKTSWDQGITFAFHKSRLSNLSFDTIDEGFQSLLDADPLDVRVKKPKKSILLKNDRQIYSIRSTPKGVLLIINLKNYLINSDNTSVDDPSESDLQRRGSERDVGYVRDLFSQMGYKVVVKEDLFDPESLSYQLDEFKRTLKRLKPDIALMFLMGHGTNEGLQMINGDVVNVWTEIIYKFTNDSFPEMRGKPKVFSFQSCQDFISCGLLDAKMKMNPSDIIVSTAAAPGCSAHRMVSIGSFYIYKLVEILMKNSWKKNLIEMLDQLRVEMTEISVKTNEDLNDDEIFIQVPNYNSFLTKRLYFQ